MRRVCGLTPDPSPVERGEMHVLECKRMRANAAAKAGVTGLSAASTHSVVPPSLARFSMLSLSRWRVGG